MKRNIRIGVSVLISLVFLFIAGRGVDWARAGEALSHASYAWAIPMLLITPLTMLIRALRWRVLLRPVGAPSLGSLYDATSIGFMANMVLPLRVGEVIRPVLLSRREKLPMGAVLATIVIERIFDILALITLFGIAASAVTVSPAVKQAGQSLCVVAVILTAGVIFVRWQEKLALRILEVVLTPLPTKIADPLNNFALGFVKALETLDGVATFVRLFAWSITLWLVIAVIYGCGIIAFGFPAPLIMGSLVVTTIVAIAVSAPSAPGYIGAFQVGCALALSIFSVSESDAFAYSIILHLTQFVGVIAAGIYSLARQGLSLSELGTVSDNEPTVA